MPDLLSDTPNAIGLRASGHVRLYVPLAITKEEVTEIVSGLIERGWLPHESRLYAHVGLHRPPGGASQRMTIEWESQHGPPTLVIAFGPGAWGPPGPPIVPIDTRSTAERTGQSVEERRAQRAFNLELAQRITARHKGAQP